MCLKSLLVVDATAVYTYLSVIKMAKLHPLNKREINIVELQSWLNMKVFFVDYDLRKEKDYKTLTDELERLGGIRVLKSLWSLKLADTITCAIVRDHLKRFIDKDDGIIVSEVVGYAYSNVDNAPHKFQ